MDNRKPVQPYKYNGKELDEKRGLNWYDYGARQYDAAIGRFMTVDPMAEKYHSVSTYTYCLNNPIYFIDKNGLEPGPGDLFKTPRAAAKDWGMYYNGPSIIRKREMGSTIYEVKENGTSKGYSYSAARMSDGHKTKVSHPRNSEEIVGTIHSHGNYDGIIIDKNGTKNAVGDNKFSRVDKDYNVILKIVGYLATPNGSLLEYDPITGKVNTISTELPSDPNDPTRMNKIEPIDKIKLELESTSKLDLESKSLIDQFMNTLKSYFK